MAGEWDVEGAGVPILSADDSHGKPGTRTQNDETETF